LRRRAELAERGDRRQHFGQRFGDLAERRDPLVRALELDEIGCHLQANQASIDRLGLVGEPRGRRAGSRGQWKIGQPLRQSQ